MTHCGLCGTQVSAQWIASTLARWIGCSQSFKIHIPNLSVPWSLNGYTAVSEFPWKPITHIPQLRKIQKR